MASFSHITRSPISQSHRLILTFFFIFNRVGPGFFNHGNTCFLNSTLQCLIHTPPLVQILLFDNTVLNNFNNNNNEKNKNNNHNNHNNNNNVPILLLFKRFIDEIYKNNNSLKVISPRQMVNTLRRLNKSFHSYQQEDAHEYLYHLLNTLHNEILKKNNLSIYGQQQNNSNNDIINIYDTTFIARIFSGKFCNILTCLKCQYQSKTFNSFQDISLNIGSGIQTINNSIDNYIKIEKLDQGNEWLCERCKKKVPVSNFLLTSSIFLIF